MPFKCYYQVITTFTHFYYLTFQVLHELLKKQENARKIYRFFKVHEKLYNCIGYNI